MGKVVRIPAGNTTNEHYNFVVAKPLVYIKVPGLQLNRNIIAVFTGNFLKFSREDDKNIKV